MSLADQLLKAGLVNDKKVKKAKKSKSNKKTRDLKKEVKAAAEQTRAEQLERTKALNEQRDLEAKQKAVAAQIKQLIESNEVTDIKGEVAYNFTDQSVVKSVLVTERARKQLANGQLAVCVLGESYKVVPAGVADKIAQRDASYIVLNNEVEEVDEDDPYKDFVIPDDLMW